MWEDEKLASKLGGAARRLVEERFDINKTAQKYHDLYASLISAGQEWHLPYTWETRRASALANFQLHPLGTRSTQQSFRLRQV